MSEAFVFLGVSRDEFAHLSRLARGQRLPVALRWLPGSGQLSACSRDPAVAERLSDLLLDWLASYRLKPTPVPVR